MKECYTCVNASVLFLKGAIMTRTIACSAILTNSYTGSRTNKLLKNTVFVAILCLFVATLAACSGDTAISGSYACDVEQADGSILTTTYTFTGDDQVTVEATSSSGEILFTASGTYKIIGNSIEVTGIREDITVTFERRGSSLFNGDIELKKV